MGFNIIHIGAFDIENFGDLLFVDVLKKQLSKYVDIESITYFSPKECDMPNRKDIHIHSILELDSYCKNNKVDAIIVGGGDLIHLKKVIMYMPHISEDWVTYEPIFLWVTSCMVSAKYNIPLLWNAPGCPIQFNENEISIVSSLLDCVDYISVRDEEAKSNLALSKTDKKIHVIPDTVLSISKLINKESLEMPDLPIEKGKYVFFQCNNALTEEELKKCADLLNTYHLEKGLDILIQPIGVSMGDVEVIHKLHSYYPDTFIVSDTHLTQYDILALIANAELYIGTSLHGCIVANSYGVKNIAYNINHYNKTIGFMNLMKRSQYIAYTANELKEMIYNVQDVDLLVLESCIQAIDSHFKAISKIIGTKKEHIDLNINKISDIIFEAVEVPCIYKNQIQQLLEQDTINKKRIEKLEAQVNSLNEKYNDIINSTTWKASEPLRKLKNSINE